MGNAQVFLLSLRMSELTHCFNCNGKGHLSINCPLTQYVRRCAYCVKTNGHHDHCISRTHAVMPFRTLYVPIATRPRETKAQFTLFLEGAEGIIFSNDSSYLAVREMGIELGTGSCRLTWDGTALAFIGQPTKLIEFKLSIGRLSVGMQVLWAVDSILIADQYHIKEGQLTTYSYFRNSEPSVVFKLIVRGNVSENIRLAYGDKPEDRYLVKEKAGITVVWPWEKRAVMGGSVTSVAVQATGKPEGSVEKIEFELAEIVGEDRENAQMEVKSGSEGDA